MQLGLDRRHILLRLLIGIAKIVKKFSFEANYVTTFNDKRLGTFFVRKEFIGFVPKINKIEGVNIFFFLFVPRKGIRSVDLT